MTASTDLKLLESMQARFEVGLLGAECLVEDICTCTQRTKRNTCAKTQNRPQNLIRFKLVQNIDKSA